MQDKESNWAGILDCCAEHFAIFASFDPHAIINTSSDDLDMKSNLIMFITDLFCALTSQEDVGSQSADEEQQHDMSPALSSTSISTDSVKMVKSTQLIGIVVATCL